MLNKPVGKSSALEDKLNDTKRHMNTINRDKKKDVICSCSGTTEEQIRELIEEGVDNLDRISRITGACSGCGSCDTSILELLAE